MRFCLIKTNARRTINLGMRALMVQLVVDRVVLAVVVSAAAVLVVSKIFSKIFSQAVDVVAAVSNHGRNVVPIFK